MPPPLAMLNPGDRSVFLDWQFEVSSCFPEFVCVHACVRACVCVCPRARVCVCARACVRVCVGIAVSSIIASLAATVLCRRLIVLIRSFSISSPSPCRCQHNLCCHLRGLSARNGLRLSSPLTRFELPITWSFAFLHWLARFVLPITRSKCGAVNLFFLAVSTGCVCVSE